MGFPATRWRSVALAAFACMLFIAGSTSVGAAPSGLVAAYSFDAGSGTTLADASGTGNTGTIAGATWSSAGKNGGALSFDGSGDMVTVAGSPSLDVNAAVTLEAWVRPTTLGGDWRTVLVKERPGHLNYALYAHDGGPGPSGHVNVGGSDRFSAAPPVPANAWTHLATTYDGTSLKLYVNGVVATTLAVGGPIATATNPLRIGGNSVWGEWFSGLIDDVRVYNRALSPSEIQTDMATAVGPSSTTPPPPTDTQAPSVPQGLRVAGTTATSATLGWNASTDNVGVTGYEVFRDGSPIATVGAVTTYADTTVSPLTHYDYAVKAIDAAGNRSTPSNTAGVSTPAPPASTTVTFDVAADARVEEPTPDTNYGSSSKLRSTNGSPVTQSFLKFALSGISGTVQAAKLRIFDSNDATNNGPTTYKAASTWTESGITWNNRPALTGTPSDNKVQIAIGTWVEYDVTTLVTGNGDLTIALIPDSTDGANFASKEYTDPSKKAQLEVTYGG
jgi:chitodextrinase